MMRVTVEKLVAARPGCSEKWLALVEDAQKAFVLRRVVASEQEARALVAPFES